MSEPNKLLDAWLHDAPEDWLDMARQINESLQRRKNLYSERHNLSTLSEMREFVEKVSQDKEGHKKMMDMYNRYLKLQTPFELFTTIFQNTITTSDIYIQLLDVGDNITHFRDITYKDGNDFILEYYASHISRPHPHVVVIKACNRRALFIFNSTDVCSTNYEAWKELVEEIKRTAQPFVPGPPITEYVICKKDDDYLLDTDL